MEFSNWAGFYDGVLKKEGNSNLTWNPTLPGLFLENIKNDFFYS